jgi:hypothetical protein
MRPPLLGAAAATVAIIVLGTPAVAGEQASASSLVITAYNGEDTSWPVVKEVTLKCEPTGGSHTEAEEACASIESVGGNLDELMDRQLICPEVYQPVTVEVGGNWNDMVVAFEHTYPNLCFAYSASDGVFTF